MCWKLIYEHFHLGYSRKQITEESEALQSEQWDRVALGFEDEAYLSFSCIFPLTMHLRYPLFPFSYTVPT